MKYCIKSTLFLQSSFSQCINNAVRVSPCICTDVVFNVYLGEYSSTYSTLNL